MPTNPVSNRELLRTAKVYRECGGSQAEATRRLKISSSTLSKRMTIAKEIGVIGELDYPLHPTLVRTKKREFTVAPFPDGDAPIEDLVEWRKKQFAQKKEHEEARKLIKVNVNIDGPFGILHFGDPHVDDDGTDIELLEKHSDLTRSVEGLFAANVGDIQNNWVGRLARLYAQQSTSAAQSWALAEWLIKRATWLYIVGGNHDGWSGDGDPLKWICRQADTLYQSSEVRIELACRNGRKIRVNCRHDFAGHSQYNPAHGATKSILMGVRDHIAICGHKHVSGHVEIKCPDTGINCHALQVASYKIYDRYARTKGFRDQNLSPCVVTVTDPYLPETHPDQTKVFWDAGEGADFLKYKRAKFKRKK